MSTADQFYLALQAYQEIQAELSQKHKTSPLPETPAKVEADRLLPSGFPNGSLLLGMADDGLPILLNLYDPVAGPILVAGDGGSGKTAFLHSLARVSNLQDPGDLSFSVLTPFPEEWVSLETLPNCLGVWPAYHPSAQHFLSQMVNWADSLPDTRQLDLLLFDGLDLMVGSNFQSQHVLRWLLMYGPEKHIWPVVSVNPARFTHLQTWVDYFHTRVIGRVQHPHNARLLVDTLDVDLGNLSAGNQFYLSRPEGWLKFWLPPLE